MNSFDAREEFIYFQFMQKNSKNTTGQISVRFPPDLFKGIEAMCNSEDRTAANAVKVLVREALEHRKLLTGSSQSKR